MKVHVEMTEQEIRRAIVAHLRYNLGRDIPAEDVVILVKSKLSYKSEWEQASFKAEFNSSLPDKDGSSGLEE